MQSNILMQTINPYISVPRYVSIF